MAIRLSTGLINQLMDTDAFRDIFALGFIDIYTGTQPANADLGATGTLLCTLTSDGDGVTGLSWAATATDGALSKSGAETWQGTVVSTGTAGWFRLRAAGDAGTSLSTTAPRYDGAVSTSGAEMNLGTVNLIAAAPLILTGATFTMPKQV